jgi:hypothetical protein
MSAHAVGGLGMLMGANSFETNNEPITFRQYN